MGTFVEFHWYPRSDRSWRDLFCLRVMQLHRGRPGFSCDQCTLLTFDPKRLLLDGHDDKQIYIVFFSSFLIYKWKSQVLDSHQINGNGRIFKIQNGTIQEWWKRWLLILYFFLKFQVYFSYFLCRLDHKTGMDDASLPRCLKCGVTE